MGFKPKVANFEERVRGSLARQAVMTHLGITVSRIAPGEVHLSFPYDTSLTQHHGIIHAGITTTALDSACGYAAFSLMDESSTVLTVEFKTTLMAVAQGQWFRAEGRVIRAGRRLTFCEGRAYALSDNSETLIATMSATMMAVPENMDA